MAADTYNLNPLRIIPDALIARAVLVPLLMLSALSVNSCKKQEPISHRGDVGDGTTDIGGDGGDNDDDDNNDNLPSLNITMITFAQATPDASTAAVFSNASGLVFIKSGTNEVHLQSVEAAATRIGVEPHYSPNPAAKATEVFLTLPVINSKDAEDVMAWYFYDNKTDPVYAKAMPGLTQSDGTLSTLSTAGKKDWGMPTEASAKKSTNLSVTPLFGFNMGRL